MSRIEILEHYQKSKIFEALKGVVCFRFSGCSEKSDSCKATIYNLKVVVYFSDINKCS